MDAVYERDVSDQLVSFNYLLGRPRLRQVRTRMESDCSLPGESCAALAVLPWLCCFLCVRVLHSVNRAGQRFISQSIKGNYTCFDTFNNANLDTDPLVIDAGLSYAQPFKPQRVLYCSTRVLSSGLSGRTKTCPSTAALYQKCTQAVGTPCTCL